MTGTTPGFALPYPDDYNQPADSPSAFQALAVATDNALALMARQAPTTANLTAHTNFQVASAGPHLAKMGTFVVARGLFTVTATLNVTDNGIYQFATIPAAFRPSADVRMAGTWAAYDTGRASTQIMTTQFRALATGELQFVSNVAGTLRTGGDYVAAGGLVWWTA